MSVWIIEDVCLLIYKAGASRGWGGVTVRGVMSNISRMRSSLPATAVQTVA